MPSAIIRRARWACSGVSGPGGAGGQITIRSDGTGEMMAGADEIVEKGPERTLDVDLSRAPPTVP